MQADELEIGTTLFIGRKIPKHGLVLDKGTKIGEGYALGTREQTAAFREMVSPGWTMYEYRGNDLYDLRAFLADHLNLEDEVNRRFFGRPKGARKRGE